MKRTEITASSVLLGLAILLATCFPAQAARVYIDIESEREAPIFRPLAGTPSEPWAHPITLHHVEKIGEKLWRIEASYPDDWTCALISVTEFFHGETEEDPGFVVWSENGIQFGDCTPQTPWPISEPPADLMAAVGLGGAVALAAWRRHGQS